MRLTIFEKVLFYNRFRGLHKVIMHSNKLLFLHWQINFHNSLYSFLIILLYNPRSFILNQEYFLPSSLEKPSEILLDYCCISNFPQHSSYVFGLIDFRHSLDSQSSLVSDKTVFLDLRKELEEKFGSDVVEGVSSVNTRGKFFESGGYLWNGLFTELGIY